jgi:hypothetical protein
MLGIRGPLAHKEWLEQSVLSHAVRKLGEGIGIEPHARLLRVRLQDIDR